MTNGAIINEEKKMKKENPVTAVASNLIRDDYIQGHIASMSPNFAAVGFESQVQYCQAEHQSTVLQQNNE
jgi:hypothetical protein